MIMVNKAMWQWSMVEHLLFMHLRQLPYYAVNRGMEHWQGNI